MKIESASAIVTGGASGLGLATAQALAKSGAKVAILDLQMAVARQAAQALDGIAAECDVADADSVEQALALARKAHGPVSIAVNCAGIAPPARILGREGPMPLADFKRVIDVNLAGSFNVMRLACAEMAQTEPNPDNERGVIIMTASVAAFDGQIGQASYSASKAGLVGLTLPAARELASLGIRVVTIAPGLFATPLLTSLPENVQTRLAESIPFPKRLGAPDEFAKLVLHIVDNAMLNGEVIRLDGALRMQPK